MSQKDSRTILLLGKSRFKRLNEAHVMVVGLGGVGGYALEQLVRAGIQKFTIVDSDKVAESNINRQLIANYKDIGRFKTEVFAERLLLINPDVEVQTHTLFLDNDGIESMFADSCPDYVVDAIDTLKPKVNLIEYCLPNNIPVVSALGAGGKLNPEMVRTVDISETYNDGLGRMLRKRLHKKGIRSGFKAVFSPEDVSRSVIIQEQSQNKKTNVGTISYMPAVFGMHCAAAVIRDLTDARS